MAASARRRVILGFTLIILALSMLFIGFTVK